MKQFTITIITGITIMIIAACVPSKVNVKKEVPYPGNVTTVYTGDVFFEKVNCYGTDNGMGVVFNGDCIKYDLSLIGVTNDKISLEYREYMKPVTNQGYKINAPWLVKDGFTRKLEYSSNDKEIRYKGHTFQVLELASGTITYRKK